MAAYIDYLKGVEFHKKKLRRYASVRDLDKDGTVRKEDYDLIVKRYQEGWMLCGDTLP